MQVSTSSEKNTCFIAFVGYAMWYLCFPSTKIGKVLLWINFILLAILPIDILCPKRISAFLLNTLNLGIIIITITWGLMVYKTFTSYFRSSKL